MQKRLLVLVKRMCLVDSLCEFESSWDMCVWSQLSCPSASTQTKLCMDIQSTLVGWNRSARGNAPCLHNRRCRFFAAMNASGGDGTQRQLSIALVRNFFRVTAPLPAQPSNLEARFCISRLGENDRCGLASGSERCLWVQNCTCKQSASADVFALCPQMLYGCHLTWPHGIRRNHLSSPPPSSPRGHHFSTKHTG